MIKLVLLVFVLNTFMIWSQDLNSKLIHGKVIADTTSVEGINVLNLVNEKSTATDKNGEFYILAKDQDLLLLTAVNFEIKRKLIEEDELKNEIVYIKMTPKITELKEVKVNQYSQINAVNLGIVSKDIKRYTPAERRLYTATTGGGIIPIDPILNWMSGRTAMLKKEIIIEKKEILLVKLDGQFDDEYYINILKIPQDYIKGFQYYIIEDNEFASALLAKNKTLMKYIMNRLAINYNQMKINEK